MRVIAMTSPPAIIQSFDCRKAASAAEKMVCQDPALSRLDEEMSRAFAEAGRRAGTVPGQQAWLRTRDACADPACVKWAYESRIAYLKGELTGEWKRKGNTRHGGASITITKATPASIDFTLFSSSGMHMGEIEGTALRKGGVATYRDPDSECKVTFRQRMEWLVVTTAGCASMGGMGVVFDGEFSLGLPDAPLPTLTQLRVLAPGISEVSFAALTGKSYERFIESFDLIGENEDLDGIGAHVRSGFVRGLDTEEAAIVMSRAGGKIYAAVLDEDVIKYFSNDPLFLTKLPATIEAWRRPFPDRKVVFASAR
jgi:hypothetical protein